MSKETDYVLNIYNIIVNATKIEKKIIRIIEYTSVIQTILNCKGKIKKRLECWKTKRTWRS